MSATLTPTARLARWARFPPFWRVVTEVADAFPELRGVTVRVDLLSGGSRRLGAASIFERPPRIALHPSLLNDPEGLAATAAHELTHLLQWPLRELPNGERACDLYVLARFGTRFVGAPYYLRVPSRVRRRWAAWAPLASDLAREAIQERERGRRQYIRWWENELRARTARPGATFGEAASAGAFWGSLGATQRY
jgi:hypothetical protein